MVGACLCSTVSGASAGKTWYLGSGDLTAGDWNHLEASSVLCLAADTTWSCFLSVYMWLLYMAWAPSQHGSLGTPKLFVAVELFT